MTGSPQQQEFISLINQHQGIIYKICRLYTNTDTDREDMFQEIVIQLWKGYPKFRGDAKFSTWMYRIALNTAVSDIRKQSRRVEISFPESIPGELADISGDKEKEEKIYEMYIAIAQLPEIDRALVMLYLEDKSYDEMEDILGINQNNLRVKMNRIKEKLRRITKKTEIYGT